MKIGLLTHSVNPRGGVVHTLELARALHCLGHEPTVFAPAMTGQSLFREVPHRVELVPVGRAPPGLREMVADRIAAFESHLRALPDRHHFDVWHSHDGIGGNALANLVDAGLIEGFVRTVHHLDRFDDAQVMRWQQRSFERAARVLCVSELWCRTMREDHGVSALRVDNGVDLQRFQPAAQAADDEVAVRLGLRPGAPLWLAVGGVEERKNTLRSLQAFAMHRRWHAQAQLVIAGGASLLDHGAYQATFHEALVDSGLGDDAVRLIGTVADADMPALYRLADGLLMPSLREGFGLVVLEALASATPVVVSRLAPFTEFLANADACWADPLVAADIAAAMGRALRITITEVPEVCRRFDWRRSALRHAEIYAGLREGATLAGA